MVTTGAGTDITDAATTVRIDFTGGILGVLIVTGTNQNAVAAGADCGPQLLDSVLISGNPACFNC